MDTARSHITHTQRSSVICKIFGRTAIVYLFTGFPGLSAIPGFAQEPSTTTLTSAQQAENESTEIEWQLLDRIKQIDAKRVVMHAQEPAARLALQLESLFSSVGMSDIELRYVNQVPEKAEVRYYHNVDGEAGQVVADVLTLVFDQVDARNFQNYQPAPDEGLIEIWIP